MNTAAAAISTARGIEPSPAIRLLIAAFIVAILSIMAIYQALQQPWLGARFAVSPVSSEGIVVTKIDHDGPADGVLKVGQKLVAISDGHNQAALDPIMLEEPNNFRRYHLYNQSAAIQQKVWPILLREKVSFLTNQGDSLDIYPESRRPLSALPWPYFFYGPLSAIGITFALLIWIRNPEHPASLFIQLIVWDIFLTLTVTVLIDRELAHPQAYLATIAAMENIGTALFFPFWIALFSVYPRPLLTTKAALMIPAAALLIPINSTCQWIELPFHSYIINALPGLLIFLIMVAIQWYCAKESLADLQRIKSVFLWIFVPFLFPFIAFALPVMATTTPLLSVVEARMFVCGIGIGLALGILLHGLFDVNRWMINIFVWLGIATIVLLIDAIVVSALHLSGSISVALSIVLAALIYFPLRQRLLFQLLPRHGEPIITLLPLLAKQMKGAARPSEYDARWSDLLTQHFNPAAQDATIVENQNQIDVFNNGLELVTPSIDGVYRITLHGKLKGSRLFDQNDADVVRRLLGLVRLLKDAALTEHRAQLRQRRQLMRQLDSTLGTKLHFLLKTVTRESDKAKIINTLKTLQDTINYSSNLAPISFKQLVQRWDAELQPRVKALAITTRWQLDPHLTTKVVGPLSAIVLSNILREAVTNALKHAKPDALVITATLHQKKVRLAIRNNGEIRIAERRHAGTGLNGMRSRARSIGGEFHVAYIGQERSRWFMVIAIIPTDQ